MSAPVTPALATLHDLVATMQALSTLYAATHGCEPTAAEDRQLSKLEDRRAALEQQLQDMVRDQMGIDYATLWHAVTPK